jgi:hypothetical protein
MPFMAQLASTDPSLPTRRYWSVAAVPWAACG